MNHSNKTLRLVEHTYIFESNPSFYFEQDVHVAYLHHSKQNMATFSLFIFEEQQDRTFSFIVLKIPICASTHNIFILLPKFCIHAIRLLDCWPQIQCQKNLLGTLLLLVRSLRALAPQLTACVGCVVAAPARAIAEIMATSAQASLAFGDGRGIASALLALALPRYLEKCKLEKDDGGICVMKGCG